MNDIINTIIEWFCSKTGTEAEIITNNSSKNYFEEKWLDSLTFLEFVVFLENRFNVHFSNDEFQDKKFATIDGLTEIIERKLK